MAAWISIAAQWRRLAGLIVCAGLLAPFAGQAQGTLNIGLVPAEDPRLMIADNRAMIEALRASLDMEVRPFVATDYNGVIEALRAKKLDVARKAQRRLSARREQRRSIWFSLGLFGMVGWSVAIPTLLGIALGVWLDRQFAGRVSWTLTLLFVGLVIGCLNAWYWVKQETREDE